LPEVLAAQNVRLAYVFGSAARILREGGEGAPRDIDLAYFPGGGFSFPAFYAAVSGVLGTDRLDLVDLRRASPGLVYEIVTKGYVIYRESEEMENRFERSALALVRDEAIRLRYLFT
jgi:predicted nucleotidyltransferase